MSTMTVTPLRLRDGIWHVLIVHGTAGTPRISVTHRGTEVADVTLSETDSGPDHWALSVPLPKEVLSDGVQTLVVSDASNGDVLTHLSLIAGEAVGDDMRGEVDLMRAELDMLKRAFRRHCSETE